MPFSPFFVVVLNKAKQVLVDIEICFARAQRMRDLELRVHPTGNGRSDHVTMFIIHNCRSLFSVSQHYNIQEKITEGIFS